MKTIRLLFFLLAIILCFGQKIIIAQQLSLSNQYVVNKFSLSPSYAGTEGNAGIYGSYRRDWIGIDGAPETKIISANGPVCKNMGLGGTISSLQAGIFTNLSAILTYAYHVKLSGSNTLSVGLGLGILENHLDLSNYNESVNDPVLLSMDRTNTKLDASFGITFRHKNFYLGFSAPRLLGTNKGSYWFWPQQQAHIGYKYDFNNTWSINPVLIAYLPKDAPKYYEVAIPIVYQQKIWITLAVKKISKSLGIGFCLKSNLILNYTFESSSKDGFGRKSGSSGTHEITLGWKFGSKKNTNQLKHDSKKPYYDWVNK